LLPFCNGKQVEFKTAKWGKFQVTDLFSNSYIRAGDRYVKPADAQDKTVVQALRASMLRLARCHAGRRRLKLVHGGMEAGVLLRGVVVGGATICDAKAIMSKQACKARKCAHIMAA
jgi:hypothetical protein